MTLLYSNYMNIKVKDENLGECNVKSYVDLDKDLQYLIKSLSVLQILCLSVADNKEKHRELIKIFKEAAEKADKLFTSEISKVEINATEYFD
jgi:thiaminase